MASKEAEAAQGVAESVMSLDKQLKFVLENGIRDQVKEAAAKMSSININMDAALYKKADQLGLGELKTDEVYVKAGNTEYVAQGFTDGIVYTEAGHWDQAEIQMLPWEVKAKEAKVAETASDSVSIGSTTSESGGGSIESGSVANTSGDLSAEGTLISSDQ